MKLIEYKKNGPTVSPLHYDCFGYEIAGKTIKFNNVAVSYVEMPKTGGAENHRHPVSEHIYIPLEGELRIDNGKEVIIVPAGTAAHVEAGEPHKVDGNGKDSKYIVMLNPIGEILPA
jgi:quercetin dioxygenase-like cupin family protein